MIGKGLQILESSPFHWNRWRMPYLSSPSCGLRFVSRHYCVSCWHLLKVGGVWGCGKHRCTCRTHWQHLTWTLTLTSTESNSKTLSRFQEEWDSALLSVLRGGPRSTVPHKPFILQHRCSNGCSVPTHHLSWLNDGGERGCRYGMSVMLWWLPLVNLQGFNIPVCHPSSDGTASSREPWEAWYSLMYPCSYRVGTWQRMKPINATLTPS